MSVWRCLSDTICLSLSVWHCLSDTVCLTLSVWQCLSVTVCLTLSVWHCLSGTVCLTLSVFHYMSGAACLTLSAMCGAVFDCSNLLGFQVHVCAMRILTSVITQQETALQRRIWSTSRSLVSWSVFSFLTRYSVSSELLDLSRCLESIVIRVYKYTSC